jgi:thiol:disulfide interchange protein DsbD
MWGAPLNALAGYLPPMSTHDFNLPGMIREASGLDEDLCEKPKYSDKLHLPHGLKGYFDYEQGMKCAAELKKPVFIDFTGHGCVNCREMEARVWSDPRVIKILKEEYVIISLYVDDKTIELPENEQYFSKINGRKITNLAKKNADLQMCYFNANAQPLYVLMDNQEDLLAIPRPYDLDKDAYVQFLEDGVKRYKENLKK